MKTEDSIFTARGGCNICQLHQTGADLAFRSRRERQPHILQNVHKKTDQINENFFRIKGCARIFSRKIRYCAWFSLFLTDKIPCPMSFLTEKMIHFSK